MKRVITFVLSIVMMLVLAAGMSAGDTLDRGDELLNAGQEALQAEDYDSAIEQLQEAVKLQPDNSVYRCWLGRAYISKLQTVSFFERGVLAGRALDNLTKAVDLDPTNVKARILLGNYYLNAPSIAGGSKKKAREQAEAVRQYAPVEANAMLATIHIKDKEHDEAIEKFRACVAAEPDNVDYRYRLGGLYQSLERYDETFDVFEAILEFAPDDPGALYQIGRTAALSGENVDRGIECLRIYVKQDLKPGYPGFDGAHWRLGMLFEHKGDITTARGEYETAMQLNPDEDRYRESLQKLAQN